MTILTEIEGVLNSRPLTYSCGELGEPLTPAHLIIGRRIFDKPTPLSFESGMELDADIATRRAKHLRNILNQFRNRFLREYLTELREHHREIKKNRGTPIERGHVVTVYEDKIPRHRWRLGRVEKLLRGNDGEVQSAIVRVMQKGQKSTTIKRQLRKLFPVELSEVEEVAAEEPQIKFVADHEVGMITDT